MTHALILLMGIAGGVARAGPPAMVRVRASALIEGLGRLQGMGDRTVDRLVLEVRARLAREECLATLEAVADQVVPAAVRECPIGGRRMHDLDGWPTCTRHGSSFRPLPLPTARARVAARDPGARRGAPPLAATHVVLQITDPGDPAALTLVLEGSPGSAPVGRWLSSWCGFSVDPRRVAARLGMAIVSDDRDDTSPSGGAGRWHPGGQPPMPGVLALAVLEPGRLGDVGRPFERARLSIPMRIEIEVSRERVRLEADAGDPQAAIDWADQLERAVLTARGLEYLGGPGTVPIPAGPVGTLVRKALGQLSTHAAGSRVVVELPAGGDASVWAAGLAAAVALAMSEGRAGDRRSREQCAGQRRLLDGAQAAWMAERRSRPGTSVTGWQGALVEAGILRAPLTCPSGRPLGVDRWGRASCRLHGASSAPP